jgi:hypothetical protein
VGAKGSAERVGEGAAAKRVFDDGDHVSHETGGDRVEINVLERRRGITCLDSATETLQGGMWALGDLRRAGRDA